MKRRYLSAIILLVVLLGAGSYMLVRSSTNPARAATRPQPPQPLGQVRQSTLSLGPRESAKDVRSTLRDSTWVIETVDPSIGPYGGGSNTSLALDQAGQPHISYHTRTTYDLMYAHHDGVRWMTETVDNQGHVGAYTSIALDSTGHSHISYADVTNYYLKYAHHDGTEWQIETVETTWGLDRDTSLALDSEGHPHISSYNARDNELRYSHFNGLAWINETVESGNGPETSLALDNMGRPHISYCRHSPPWGGCDFLKYAYHDGTDWQAETVDWSVGVGHRTSLALDSKGYPHIAYYRNGGDVKYARSDGMAWEIEIVEEGGSDPSLVLDHEDHPHISYCRRSSPVDLIYAHYDGSTWVYEVVEEDCSCSDTSLALDQNGYPHISYRDNINNTLRYARKAGGGPILQLPFNPAEQTGPYCTSQNGLNCISSYFDHRYPLYDAEGAGNTNTVVVYSGDEIPTVPPSSRCRPQKITGADWVCYSGHDAYDFYLPVGSSVLAAAGGDATYAWDNCAGNIVRIDHGNGYSTEYLHLLNDGHLLRTPTTVTTGTRIGSVGQPPSTNCGKGYHLHFAVRNNGVVVDPYGWSGNYQDPWPLNGGAESTCLWNFSCPTRGVSSPEAGGMLSSSDGNVLVSVPPGAVTDTTLLQLALTPDPVAEPSAVPAWHSFALSAQDMSGNPVVDFAEPITVEVSYSDTDVTHLLENTLSLYSWDDLTSAWLPISTVLDLVNNKATANITHISLFTLMGQPQNPAPTVTSVSPNSGYSHVDTEITIDGTDFLPTPSVRLGPNELAVTFIDSASLTAVVPSGLDLGVYTLAVTNPDAQEGTLESAFTVQGPLKVYLPLIFKNY